MSKVNLQALLEQLKTLEDSLPKDDTLSLVNQIVSDKYKKFTEDTKQDTSLQALDSINNKLDKFKQDFDLKPVIDSIDEIRSTIEQMQTSTADEFTKNSQTSDLSKQELLSLIGNTKTDLQGMTDKQIADVLTKITALEGQMTFSDSSNKEQGQNLKTVVKKIETKLNSFSKNLTDTQAESGKSKEEDKKNNEAIQSQFLAFEKQVKDLRLQFQKHGGGSMPPKISVNGVVISTRYADINFKAGSNITLTKADNNTTKQADFTITSTGGSGSGINVETPTGAVNGTNTTFTTANNPVGVIIDNQIYWGVGDGYTVSGSGPYTITTNTDRPPISTIRDFYISSSGGFNIATPSGTVNGINTIFTTSQTPIAVIIDNLIYWGSGNGYSFSAGTITTNSDRPPVSSIRIFY